MRSIEPQPGHEFRGLVIRLYPTEEQERQLKLIEDDLRGCWNWLVKQTEEVLNARRAYAVREGLVPQRPVRPDYDGMSPDESHSAKEAHRDACWEWERAVSKATKSLPCCAFRSIKDEIARGGHDYDYQLFQSSYFRHPEGVKLTAHMYQAMVKNYFSGRAKDGKGLARGQRRKQFRRKCDSMPLQVRSGDCFEVGNFGSRGANRKDAVHPLRPFYDCQIKFGKLKILGRLPDVRPSGRILEGVSITKHADGWYASVKQEVPIRQLPDPVQGSHVGIDVGLDCLVAFGSSDGGHPLDGVRVKNPRERVYSERIAGRQAQGKEVGRLQQAAARHVKHLIYNSVIKPIATTEVIKVEKLSPKVGQLGSRKTSSMRSVIQLLKSRYGDRVREVDCRYTSQTCSQCGKISKESWAYDHGPVGQCPACGYRENRDTNAARNVDAKLPILLAA